MKVIKTSKQVEELYDKVISENLLDHTCQFFEDSDDGLKPYGSGVFVVIHGEYFIFTASHVADAFGKKNIDLFIFSGNECIKVDGKVKYTDLSKSQGIDLAYIKLDKQIVPSLTKHYKFLTTKKIRRHDNLHVGKANYCVIGFPENTVEVDNGELISTALAYFTFPTNDKPYDYYKLSKENWIIVKMTGKSQDVETKEKLPLNTHFYGISGCGLWLMMLNMEEKTCDYRLIGIMTEFRKGRHFCLIGNKIHLIMEALMRFENMKFRVKK